MELDEEMLIKITETRNDVKHILEALEHGAVTFQNHTRRIQELEKQQQLLKGKICVTTRLVTGIIAVVVGFILYLWVQLVSR